MRKSLPSFLALALAGVAAAAQAAPVESLSLQERLTTAPASTQLQLGPLTATLGQLRAAHAAREAALRRLTLRGNNPPGPTAASNVVVEPQSDWAAAPADMRAFCAAAAAAACLYLPPQQLVLVNAFTGNIIDVDDLIDPSQCSSEGGQWETGFGQPACSFYYPGKITVRFSPASNFALSSSASCDKTVWGDTVDVHGAVQIHLTNNGHAGFTTGSDPSCIVRVSVGS